MCCAPPVRFWGCSVPLDLPREARQVLALLELCSNGSVQAWNTSGGARGEKDHALPPGDPNPPHLIWRRRMEQASPDQLPGLITEARGELEQIRGYGRAAVPRPKGETREEWEARLLKEGRGHEARVVAVAFKCGVRDVMRIRLGAGEDPSVGGSVARVNGSLEARRERVQQMRRGGASTRQIARLTGEAQTQVVRWTKEAA